MAEEEKKPEKKTLLNMLGFGMAKKAGNELSNRKSRLDAQLEAAEGSPSAPPPLQQYEEKPDPRKGVHKRFEDSY